MSGKPDNLRMSDFEKYKLYKWLEENKSRLTAERSSTKTVTETVNRELQMVVTDRMVDKAAATLGINLKKTDGTFVSQLFHRTDELNGVCARLAGMVESHEEALKKCRSELAQVKQMFEELVTAPAGTRYRFADGILRKV